jgi:chemotaxis signal transduction protein
VSTRPRRKWFRRTAFRSHCVGTGWSADILPGVRAAGRIPIHDSSPRPEPTTGAPSREGDGPPALLRLRSGSLRAAIPARGVQAVVRAPRTTRVPVGSGSVRSLLNFRGEVVALADLAGIPSVASVAEVTPGVGAGGAAPWAIVLRTDHDPLAIAVDGVDDLLEAPVVGAAAGSPGAGPFDRAPWLGVVKDGDGVLGVLDPEAVARALAPAEEPAAAAPPGGEANRA